MCAESLRDHALFLGASSVGRATSFSIELRHVGFAWPDGAPLFDELDFTLGDAPVGIVGANGAGKTALGELLSGRRSPQRGQVLRHGDVVHVPQGVRASSGQTVAGLAGLAPWFDALARIEAGSVDPTDHARMDGHWDLPSRFDAALRDAGLPHHPASAPADALSGGKAMRIALAGALLLPAAGLILDEPTNHLDAQGRAWLHYQLTARRGGLIVISHDRELLAHMHHIVELLPGGRCRHYGGNYAHYVAQRDGAASAAQARLDHVRHERNVALRAAREAADAQRQRSARLARAAQHANMPRIQLGQLKNEAQQSAGRERLRALAERDDRDRQLQDAAAAVDAVPVRALVQPGSAIKAGKRVLIAEGARPRHPSTASALDLALSGPFRLAISGPNGCGKTQLLHMLAGEVSPAEGHCEIHVPYAWLDQRAETKLMGTAHLMSQLTQLGSPLPEGVLRSHLALLGLGAAEVLRPMAQLSGGERLKAALACALWRESPAQLLLLDEPTNHLDLASVRALEQALLGFPGALIVVSHDRAFVDALQPTRELRWTAMGWRLEHRPS